MTGVKQTNNSFKPGFSLMEVLVSVLLFSLIIIGALNIFKLVIESQRTALATQNVEENLKYFLEVTSKEIRMAKRSAGECGVPVGQIYINEVANVTNTLKFKNYHDECVVYRLTSDGRFQITRGAYTGFLTPQRIKISDAKFYIKSNGVGSQGAVVMSVTAEALGKEINQATMKIQTTLSSRYYKKN